MPSTTGPNRPRKRSTTDSVSAMRPREPCERVEVLRGITHRMASVADARGLGTGTPLRRDRLSAAGRADRRTDRSRSGCVREDYLGWPRTSPLRSGRMRSTESAAALPVQVLGARLRDRDSPDSTSLGPRFRSGPCRRVRYSGPTVWRRVSSSPASRPDVPRRTVSLGIP